MSISAGPLRRAWPGGPRCEAWGSDTWRDLFRAAPAQRVVLGLQRSGAASQNWRGTCRYTEAVGAVPVEQGSLVGAQDWQGAQPQELASPEALERVCMRNLLASDEVVYFKDRASRFLLVSRGTAEHQEERAKDNGPGEEARFSPEDFVGRTDLDFFGAAHALAAMADEQRVMDRGEPMVKQVEHETWSEGPGRWVQTTKAPLRGHDGSIIGTFGISRDITAQFQAEQELARRESQLRAVLDSSPDAIACYNQDLRYEMVNAAAAALLGAGADEVVGRSDEELSRPTEVLSPLLRGLRRVLATKEMCEVEYSTKVAGSPKWFHVRLVPQVAPGGELTGVITATRDLTELKQVQNVLADQALHDPLTGVVNRLALIDRLNRSLAELARVPGRVALMFIDIDHFKVVNDARGHDVGDQLLVELASRPGTGHTSS